MTFHGQGGPLNVADPRSPSGFAELWLAAAEAQGLQRNADFNGAEQEGIGLYQLTQKNGERWSAARAYLAPNRARGRISTCGRGRTRRASCSRSGAPSASNIGRAVRRGPCARGAK